MPEYKFFFKIFMDNSVNRTTVFCEKSFYMLEFIDMEIVKLLHYLPKFKRSNCTWVDDKRLYSRCTRY